MDGSTVQAVAVEVDEAGNVTLQTAYDNAATPPQIVINATPDALTVDASAAGEVFLVRGITDLTLIRSSTTGSEIVGGHNAGNILTLEGALSGSADTGRVESNSPMEINYDTVSNTTPAEQFAMRWNPTFSTGAGAYVGGYLTVAPTVTIGTSTFIPATFSDTSNMLTAATPGFSAFTFINELAVIRNSGNFNLMSGLVMNVGLTHERNTSGTSTTAGATGVSFSPQTRANISGAVMTKTNQTAVRLSPTFSTVAGATANLGTIVGLQCNNPGVALFQPQAGAESMLNYWGLNVAPISFGGNVQKAAVRSAIAAASNAYFLLNVGTAQSNFNGAHLFDVGIVQHLGDGILFSNSYGAAGGDLLEYWDGTSFVFNPLTAGPELWMQFDASGHIITSDSPSTSQLRFAHEQFAFGQSGVVGNQVGLFVANARSTAIAGGWADFLLTQAGNLNLGVLGMSDVNAWVINPISFDTSAYTIAELGTLRVGGMTTSNPSGTVTERAGAWLRGRTMQQGAIQFDPITPAALAAGNNNNWAGLLTGSPSNNTRYWARIAGNVVTSVITGIDATTGQDGDTYELTNVSANAIDITDQDVASTAANRIITPSGVTYVLAADETVVVRYDLTTARWRLLGGTGA